MSNGFVDLSELGEFTASAVENDTVSFVAIYDDGRVYTCNNAFAMLTGYSKSEIAGMRWPEQFTPPDQHENMARLVQAVACDLAPYRFEKEIIRSDGTRVPVDIFVHKFCDVAGQPRYFYAFITDMTEHKMLEQALRESEAKYRELVENANSIILRMDTEGRVLFFNEYAQRFFGYSLEEIMGRNVVGTIVPETESSGRDLVAMIRDICLHPERYINNENENIRRNGERIWISWTNKAITDRYGNIMGVLCVGNDTTAVKRAETELRKARDELEARVQDRTAQLERINQSLRGEIQERMRVVEELRESEQRFRATFDQAAVGIAHVATDGRFLRLNQKYCDIVGFAQDELTRQTFQGITYPEDLDADLAYVDQLLSGAIATYSLEKRYVRKDGSIVWVNQTGSLVRGQSSEPKYFIMVIEDITQRKQAERALQEAKRRAELYVDLMGHDINNLNHAAMGYLELAQDTLKLEKDEEELIVKPMEILRNSSTLIDNVKKLQVAKSGEMPEETVDLGKMLSEVKESFAHEQGRNITINYKPVEGCIVAASRQLSDVFSNIVGNAIKHSTGKLTIDIVLSSRRSGAAETYAVTIEDDGPGMPDELKMKVFQDVLEDRTRHSRRGLGLLLVKTLVELYNGRVSVEDRVAGDRTQGTRFVVTLPGARRR